MFKATVKTEINLLKLANYIEENVTQRQIDMEEYFEGQIPYDVLKIDENDEIIKNIDCYTVACALGHATSVFETKLSHWRDGEFNMEIFGQDYFPALYSKYGLVTIPNALWDAVFGSNLDPDKTLVVQRLRDMVKYLSNWRSTYLKCD